MVKISAKLRYLAAGLLWCALVVQYLAMAPAAAAVEFTGTVALAASAPGVDPGTSISVDVGATVTLTATASQDVGPTIYWIVILDSGGGVLMRCDSGTECVYTKSWGVNTSRTYTAVVGDMDGGSPLATSETVTVTWGVVAPIDHLVLSPASATVLAEASQSYTAEGYDASNGDQGDVTDDTTFTMADGGSCSGSSCTSDVVGDHTVTGTYGVATGTATLSVRVLDHLILSPASAKIPSAGLQGYTAEGYDASDNDLGDVTSATTFTIADGGDCAGAWCTSSVVGAHTVTGTDGTATGTATLIVPALDHLVLSPPSTEISVVGSGLFWAEGYDAENFDLGDVTWATAFTVAGGGSCTDNSCSSSIFGDHTVTGTYGTATGTATLHVNALDYLALSPAVATISTGGSQTYKAVGWRSKGNGFSEAVDVTAATTLTIAGGGSCTDTSCTSSVDGDHTVTGTVGTATGTATLHVYGPLDHLVLSPAGARIAVGGSKSYTAEGYDSSNRDLGSVTTSTTFAIEGGGSCTGTSCTSDIVGDHTVTGTDGTATGTATLHVTAADVLDHIALSPASVTVVPGSHQSYAVEGYNASDTDLGVVTSATTLSITNGSCDNTAHTCSPVGLGAHTVTGIDGSAQATATLTVSDAVTDQYNAPAGSTMPFNLGTLQQTYTAGRTGRLTSACLDIVTYYSQSTTLLVTGDGGSSESSTMLIVGGSGGMPSLGWRCFPLSGAARVTSGGSYSLVLAGQSPTALKWHWGDAYSGGAGSGGGAGTYDFAFYTVVSPYPNHLVLSPGAATITAGASRAYTADAYDASDNYLQPVISATTLSISGGGSCDNTAHTCTSTVAGDHTITGTDGSGTGTATLHVNAAAATHLVVAWYPTSVVAGTAHNVTVTAKDPYNNTVTGYTGTVRLTSSDSAAVLPANSTLTSGVKTFSVTLKTAGTRTITATDTVTASITGVETGIVVGPASATHLVVAWYPTSVVAGTAHNVTVTAKDPYNNTVTGYTGTVRLTSSDSAAVLPANSTLTSGVKTFAVTLKTAGTRTITATDTVTSSITGVQAGIVVNPAAASTFVVAGLTTPRTAGVAGSVTVTARDPFGNTATGYRGTVHFTSTDTQAALPANYVFTSTDAGTHVFSVTLKTAATQSITATDTVTSTMKGSQTGIVVNPAAISKLVVSGLTTPRTHGVAGSIRVTATDAYGNTITGYIGTVHFTSTDTTASLPANYKFTSTDAGTHVFSVTLMTKGTWSVTATDTVTATIKGSQTGIVCS